jgi:hypothetical protein
MHIDEYINYEKIWDDILSEWKNDVDDLEEYIDKEKIKEKDIKELKRFIKEQPYPLFLEECSYTEKGVVYLNFSETHDESNESGTYFSYFSVLIGYNLDNEEFVYYNYEQG